MSRTIMCLMMVVLGLNAFPCDAQNPPYPLSSDSEIAKAGQASPINFYWTSTQTSVNSGQTNSDLDQTTELKQSDFGEPKATVKFNPTNSSTAVGSGIQDVEHKKKKKKNKTRAAKRSPQEPTLKWSNPEKAESSPIEILPVETGKAEDDQVQTADVEPVKPQPIVNQNAQRVDQGQDGVLDERALNQVKQASKDIYVEYNGTLYPLKGFKYSTQDNGQLKVERVDAGIRSLESKLESVNRGDQIVLGSTDGQRSDGRFFESRGASFARPQYLLPAPNQANDLFARGLRPSTTRLGSARAIEALGSSPVLDKKLLTRWNVMPQFGTVFDKGFPGDTGFNVASFPLGPQPGAGQTKFFGEQSLEQVPISLLWDNQILDIGEGQGQVYVEANNHIDREDLDIEHLYARFWNLSSITVGAGKSYSLFGTSGFAPATLQQESILIGTSELDDDKRLQFRIQRTADYRWGWGLAIEEPLSTDTVIQTGGTALTRLPTVSGNLVYSGANQVDRVQFSALARSTGFEATNGSEYFDTGWGLGVNSRKRIHTSACRQGDLYAGFAGGNGVGSYINGLNTSATFDAGEYSSVDGFGAFVGYQQFWINKRGWQLASNLAYGYTHQDTPAYMPATTNRILKQGWANVLVYPSDNVAVGLEYQYGSRETLAAGRGEDSRFMFVVALTKKKQESASAEFRSVSGERLESISDQDLGIRPGAGFAHRQGL